MTTPEVIYFYVRGVGWLAGYEEHLPKPKPERDYWAMNAFDLDIMREEIRQEWQAYRRAVRNTPPVIITTTMPRFDNTWLFETATLERDYYTTRHHIPRQIPRNPEPGEPVTTRYFPGSNTPGERVQPQENQHERRLREYREAAERFRRER